MVEDVKSRSVSVVFIHTGENEKEKAVRVESIEQLIYIPKGRDQVTCLLSIFCQLVYTASDTAIATCSFFVFFFLFFRLRIPVCQSDYSVTLSLNEPTVSLLHLLSTHRTT